MKKVLYSILGIGVVCLVIICLGKYYNQDNEVLKDKRISKETGSTQVSMMLETEYQSGVYEETNASTWPRDGYLYNETLSKCENGSKLEYDDATGKVMMYANMSDRCYVYFDKKLATFANYITSLYTTDGANGLYLHDSDLTNGAGDNSLRYAGANPDNYVCFGSDAATCPSDNLYRIIGVFNGQAKLIKNDSIGNYYWDADQYDTSTIAMLNSQVINDNQRTLKLSNANSNIIAVPDSGGAGSNDWATADIQYYLNNDYLNLFEETWKTKIATTTWSVGGMAWSDTAKQYYDGEMTYGTTYSAKIGLMYVSEYGYAASPSYWTTALGSYNDEAYTYDWMFLGSAELTISPILGVADETSYVYYVKAAGDVGDVIVSWSSWGVRPTFSLLSTTKLVDGTGTIENPFRIS